MMRRRDDTGDGKRDDEGGVRTPRAMFPTFVPLCMFIVVIQLIHVLKLVFCLFEFSHLQIWV